MAKEYTKEELWKLYEKLPQELKETVFAEETANNIYNICERNNIKDNRTSEVARYTGRTLLGVLPPDEFQETLKKEVKLEEGVAKRVAQEINRFIFYPVKASLEELYKTEINPPAGLSAVAPLTGPSEKKPSSEAIPGEKLKEIEEDKYRESIE